MQSRDDSGQAAVELVALLPVLAVLCAGLWQLVVAGEARWSAQAAAAAAARAVAVGGDAEAAARARLNQAQERGLRVTESERGVEVSLRLPGVAGLPSLGRSSAIARFPEQG